MSVTRRRSDVKTQPEGFTIDIAGPIYAIVIGPDSDVDECYILPNGLTAPVPPSALGVAGTINRQEIIHPEMIHVSVERPFIGEIKGPFRVFYPYAQAHVGTTTPRRLRPYDDALWFGSANTVPPQRKMDIELELHDCVPTWLPTRRAPLKVPYRFPNFGSTGISDMDLLIPVMGRKQHQFAIEGSAITSGGGSVTWSVTGLVVIENTDSSLQLSIAETLQADTVEAADFEESWSLDGEFDVIWIRADETTALGATAAISGYLKSWDL